MFDRAKEAETTDNGWLAEMLEIGEKAVVPHFAWRPSISRSEGEGPAQDTYCLLVRVENGRKSRVETGRKRKREDSFLKEDVISSILDEALLGVGGLV